MRNMNFQARKLETIGFLINIQDEVLFSKIEEKIKETWLKETSFKQFTQTQLVERAKRANDDFQKGKYLSQENLVKESESW
jgi:hypothetical protein